MTGLPSTQATAVENHYRDMVFRHLSGETSVEEVHELQRWLAANPAHARYYRTMENAWELAGELPERHDPLTALDRVTRRAEGVETPVIPLRPGRTAIPQRPIEGPAPRWTVAARIAAALAVLVVGALVWRMYGGEVLDGPALESYATAGGQRATLTLRDGSTIGLGANSELRFPARFRRGFREVHLIGTAQFDVAPDPRRPFEVHAAGAVTTVLGTRFVVRAYADEGRVEVAVTDGRVAVRATAVPEDDGVVIGGGELARVDVLGAARVVEGADLEPLLGWTEGRLVFRSRPLFEVAAELERWFGVEIEIADPAVADRRLTTSFDGASIDEVLVSLAAALEVPVQRNGRHVVVGSDAGM